METMIHRTQMTIKRLTTTIPPKSGPQPQGVEYNYNTVKTVKLERKYGRRQNVTKHKRAT
jgi:hypothetical protein